MLRKTGRAAKKCGKTDRLDVMPDASDQTASPLPFDLSVAPQSDELAVLSVLLFRSKTGWQVAAGSLLAMPADWALSSWRMWKWRQPTTRVRRPLEGFDLGPQFDVQPFNRVRAARVLCDREQWERVIEGLSVGQLRLPQLRCSVTVLEWMAPVLLTLDGAHEAQQVLVAACRPVRGAWARIESRRVPRASQATWAWPLPPGLEPGPELGRIAPLRKLLDWPKELLGISWLGDPRHRPPQAFVVGRLEHLAWIIDVRGDYDAEELVVDIGWDAQTVDPLSCSLIVRSHRGGLPALAREVRIADLPPDQSGSLQNARERPWSERVLTVRVPRGARRYDWGLSLFAADGRLLDERTVVPRYEQISISLSVESSSDPAVTVTIGDRKAPPSLDEQHAATRAVRAIEDAARSAAAARRFSTAGELATYLEWRFALREGELLLIDPYLLARAAARPLELSFLDDLRRPVRGLTSNLNQPARLALAPFPELSIARLPAGLDVHDRVWIVGDTALLVGTSINGFLVSGTRPQTKITTASELPEADAVAWRDRFEQWWQGRRP